MRRINVIGSSGSGKTTLAHAMAGHLRVPHLELDSIHHLPDWEPIDSSVFREQVAGFVEQDAWVVDGNYTKVRDIVWGRADTVVFLDVPRRHVMARLLRRTLGRVFLRKELWNGNRERLRDILSRDPQRNLLLWSWTRHELQQSRFEEALDDPSWSHIDFIRLRTQREVDRFEDTLAGR